MASKLITNLNGNFMPNTLHDCVIRMPITTKILFYWANAYENSFIDVLST